MQGHEESEANADIELLVLPPSLGVDAVMNLENTKNDLVYGSISKTFLMRMDQRSRHVFSVGYLQLVDQYTESLNINMDWVETIKINPSHWFLFRKEYIGQVGKSRTDIVVRAIRRKILANECAVIMQVSENCSFTM